MAVVVLTAGVTSISSGNCCHSQKEKQARDEIIMRKKNCVAYLGNTNKRKIILSKKIHLLKANSNNPTVTYMMT